MRPWSGPRDRWLPTPMPLALGRPIVPKEHGAWAMLYGSFLVGVGVAGRVTVPVALLLIGVTALAFANGALTILARPIAGPPHPWRLQRALTWLVAYAAAATAALAPLFIVYRMIFLLPFGLGAAVFFFLRAYLVRGRDDRSLSGELAGAAGLTMVGPSAHAVAVAGVHPVALVLWWLLFLFFAGSVFHVRMRVQGMIGQRRGGDSAGGPARLACGLYHLLLLLVVPVLALLGLAPWPSLLAFVPAVWRGLVGLRRGADPLDVVRLGWSEVALAAAFAILLVGAFRFAPLAG